MSSLDSIFVQSLIQKNFEDSIEGEGFNSLTVL